MSSWHTYPKIYALGNAAIAHLFEDNDLLVQEKVDGSQFSFGLIEGELRCRSKGKELVLDAPDKMFAPAVATVLSLKMDLTPGWTYRGEVLTKPKHNVLAYDRMPEKHIILFDINDRQESYLPYVKVQEEARRLGLEVVPLLDLKANTPEDFMALLETTSILGGQKIEGVVVKNYNRFTKDGKAMMGKYVSERFKEIHTKPFRAANSTQKDIISLLAEKYTTEARWDKAIQHLRERDELTDSPKDIGLLMKEVSLDLISECKEEIMEALWKHASKHILKKAVSGLPEWYKQRLFKKQFNQSGQEPTQP